MRRQAKTALAAAGGAFFTAAIAIGSAGAGHDPQDFATIEKGRYLATAADCVACHTVRHGGKPFAGGRAIETPFGDIVAPNITPDPGTGIGAWTDDQFDHAVRRGIRPDGTRLYPAMPYTSYTKMSRDDVLAIRAYLRTVAPVRNAVDRNTLPFPFNIRMAMHAWDWLFFTPGKFKLDPKKPADWNRGAFLVEGPGHCTACHTPKSFLGADKASEHLRGSSLQGWFAPDITNATPGGLGGWSVDDITAYLGTGHNRISAATGPMAEEIHNSTSHLNTSDLKAMATYLKSIPGSNAQPAHVDKNDPAMVAGAAIYRDQCSACHGLDGRGSASLFPSLTDSAMLRSADPTSAIRIVLRGARSVATAKEPTAPGMPSFAWQLDDAQVAAVLTYARNAWTSKAPAVSEANVDHVKADTSARTD